MSKKYWEFTGEVRVEEGVELKQIRAVCSFGVVIEGDLGGWISDAVNLAQNGFAWVGKAVKAFRGTIRGGTIRGGTILGGTILGGTIEGGTIRGGTIWGGDFIAISPIGSEDGQFTAEIKEDGTIICNRGCFSGTLEEFEAAVARRHGETEFAAEYALVVKLVRHRLEPIAAKRREKASALAAE